VWSVASNRQVSPKAADRNGDTNNTKNRNSGAGHLVVKGIKIMKQKNAQMRPRVVPNSNLPSVTKRRLGWPTFALAPQRGPKTLVLMLLLLPLMPGMTSAQQGRMEQGRITSSALATNLYGDPSTRPYRVYLPPSYDTSSKRYPVVYAFHGWFADENQLLNGGSSVFGVVKGLRPALDKMIRERTIGEMIVVCPNTSNKLCGSFYLNSPVIGDYETYIVKDLVTLIDTRYRTLPARESRGVTGYSMGGWGAMHLALKFPNVFSVAVAQAGRYDSRSQQADALSRQIARYHPTNFTQFMAMGDVDSMLCAFQALFAGLLPNPQRPHLYTDYPYEWINGQPVLSESADQRCRQGDVQNGDLPRYLVQSFRLNGIQIVHGRADAASPVAAARRFTNALYAAGVEFDYQEHSGQHDYLPEFALPFLSSHLQGAESYIAPPRLTLSLATNGLQLVFPTQTNVQYSVESAAGLDTSGANWTETTRVIGDGQAAKVEYPCHGKAQFFRIKAANLP